MSKKVCFCFKCRNSSAHTNIGIYSFLFFYIDTYEDFIVILTDFCSTSKSRARETHCHSSGRGILWYVYSPTLISVHSYSYTCKLIWHLYIPTFIHVNYSDICTFLRCYMNSPLISVHSYSVTLSPNIRTLLLLYK